MSIVPSDVLNVKYLFFQYVSVAKKLLPFNTQLRFIVIILESKLFTFSKSSVPFMKETIFDESILEVFKYFFLLLILYFKNLLSYKPQLYQQLH